MPVVPKTFQVGDSVGWVTQSTHKRGRVVCVVPKGAHPRLLVDEMVKQHNASFVMGGGTRRDHDSYLVLVPSEGKRKPKLYWPRVSGLFPTQARV